MSAASSPGHANNLGVQQAPQYNYEPVTAIKEEKGQDLTGTQLRALEALSEQPHEPAVRVAVEDRPAQQALPSYVESLGHWWDLSHQGIQKFVQENPLIALVTMVVFGIFGISQILPTFISALLIGVPLCYYSFIVGQTILEDRHGFTENLRANIVASAV